MGGAGTFVPAAWETVRIEKGTEVWAIPWSVYTFVVFYRRDLLERAGVDERVAFSSPEAMHETFAALKKAGIIPWATSTKPRYLDLPHIASSWARAHGGDFISPDGKQVVFNTPSTRKGLVKFFELYRFMPAQLRGLEYDACLAEFFQKGNTAVLIAGAESYSDALTTNALSDEVRGVVGVAPVPGVSWIGGDHLVVWKTVRADGWKERGAVELIRWLTTTENQARLQRETTILPARLDAYPELDFQPDGMKPALEKILQTARPHPSIRLWRRVESMLTDLLYEIGRNVLNFPNQPVAEIVESKLADEEKRFALILGR
jgi:ABC-type glycerol-3-phosphate transport system substrate-binding protein